ncbi:MAG: aspartate kinase, partial [Proteobacteria bacterium]|nr:aspartate kinase [Pseudomonadota bacterium]
SQSGIITDESHADARVVEVRPQRVRDRLEQDEVVIVAGFQGVSRAREVTTLGRGGSDTTAVVLAAALGAEYCEICSDVDGIWSADPRIVPSARAVPEMSLDEAVSLARGGAKVLFEDAVCYARDHGVDIVASSTFGPGAGTRLRTETIGQPRTVAVTGDGRLMVFSLNRDNVAALVDEIRGAGGRIRRRDGNRIYVDCRNAHGGLSALGGEKAAIVTAVGSSLGEAMEITLKADEALMKAQIPVLCCGSSGDDAWWEVKRHQLDLAVRVVHQTLIQ